MILYQYSHKGESGEIAKNSQGIWYRRFKKGTVRTAWQRLWNEILKANGRFYLQMPSPNFTQVELTPIEVKAKLPIVKKLISEPADEEIKAELPAATVSIKPRLRLSDESIQTILSHCPSAEISEQTPLRLEVDMSTTDWLQLGFWLVAKPLADIAFMTLDINDDPYTVTVVFFNPNNTLFKVKESLR